MITNNSDSHDDVLEILEGYAAATPDGNDKKILDEWVQEHPAYAKDLVEFAANRDMLAYPSPAGFESEERKREYIRRSLETYHRFVDSKLASEGTALKSIIRRGLELDLKKKELKEKLGISFTLLDSLENRAIEYSTIPRRFLANLSEVLQVQFDSVTAFFQQPIAAAEFHKHNSRPEETKAVNFSDAVITDLELTKEQKDQLLSMTAE